MAPAGFDTIIERLIRFRDERDWEQFHTSRDLALALSIEAAELNELFLWKGSECADQDKLAQELADVLIFALLLAHKHGLNVEEIILQKIQQNEEKYPVAQSKGSNRKYTELGSADSHRDNKAAD
ncbi:MAG TPA: nucleotide pyrophosphohydrolase [Dissulfurispiraceae bacterium]|nr:nucleotide pyrophosphohydrolase [Dissulfurispiraceae bacterium]